RQNTDLRGLLNAHNRGRKLPTATARHARARGVSAQHDYNTYLNLLRRDGIMVLVGLPPRPMPISAGVLVSRRRRLAGSNIGGIRETQELLDFCARKGWPPKWR